jgi:hypothetical protein
MILLEPHTEKRMSKTAGTPKNPQITDFNSGTFVIIASMINKRNTLSPKENVTDSKICFGVEVLNDQSTDSSRKQ